MKNTKEPRAYVAVALDNVSTRVEILSLVEQTCAYAGTCKIGLEQFIRFGPSILEDIRRLECRVFLDLKLHDIPNTVAKAVTAACAHHIDYLTVHASGGAAMLEAAAAAAHRASHPPALLGVTVLTSIDDTTLATQLRVPGGVHEQVHHLARLGAQAGLGGIVCAVPDVVHIRDSLPGSCEIVTPGIRLESGESHDQKRVATPARAIQDGATLLVVGRAITAHDNPSAAAKAVYDEVARALAQRID
jgi:orotidine-5'-phosphate decarboxylase